LDAARPLWRLTVCSRLPGHASGSAAQHRMNRPGPRSRPGGHKSPAGFRAISSEKLRTAQRTRKMRRRRSDGNSQEQSGRKDTDLAARTEVWGRPARLRDQPLGCDLSDNFSIIPHCDQMCDTFFRFRVFGQHSTRYGGFKCPQPSRPASADSLQGKRPFSLTDFSAHNHLYSFDSLRKLRGRKPSPTRRKVRPAAPKVRFSIWSEYMAPCSAAT